MSLELFVILVVTGFFLGVSLVIKIAQSLNPFARYSDPPGAYPVSPTGMNGWGTVLILLGLGFFLFQSKCGRDVQEWFSDTQPNSKQGVPATNNTLKTFEILSPQEQKEVTETPALPQVPDQIGREVYDPAYIPAGESVLNEIPLPSSTLPDGESNSPYFYLQVFASRQRDSAEREQESRAEQTGYSVLIGIIPGESPIQYRVLIGPFDSPEEAKAYQHDHHIEGFVQNGYDLAIL